MSLTNLGFECVVRALRIGKCLVRASQPDQLVFFYYRCNKVMTGYITPDYITDIKDYYAKTDDIMATDWETRNISIIVDINIADPTIVRYKEIQ